eukprot:15439611-Alexandrium_andersonii.AAC.1
MFFATQVVKHSVLAHRKHTVAYRARRPAQTAGCGGSYRATCSRHPTHTVDLGGRWELQRL